MVYRAGIRHVPRLQRHTPQSPTTGAVLDPDSSQLVIGASGKIGPHLITQLAQMGARTIVAVSRHGGGLDQCRQQLPAGEVTLIEVTADAADPAAMTALFDRFGADLPALEGIYLAAYAGTPVALAEMTEADVTAMFRPKLDAAALLHTLSLRTPLRHFVLFSSISGLLGSRWIGHYTATSTFLDSPGPRPPQPRPTGHRHQLGTMGIADRHPTPNPPDHHTNRPGSDARPPSHHSTAIGDAPRCTRCLRRGRRRLDLTGRRIPNPRRPTNRR